MIQLSKRYVVATTLAALLLALLYVFESATGAIRQTWYAHELKKRPRERTIRLPVVFPESSKWREVALRVTWKECPDSVNMHMCIKHPLAFDGGREQLTIQRPLSVEELPWRSFLALLEPKYSLRVAPDGHGLALWTDAGKTWQYVACDLDGPPIFFWQVTWNVDGGEPWPTTREAALAALKPNDFSNGFGRVPMEVVEQAETAAAAYACSHQGDDGLVPALVWRWAHGGPIGDGPRTLQCMVQLANERAEVRRTLVEAIERYDEKSDPGGHDHDGMVHGADVLGRLNDSSSADALADRILALLPSEDRYPLEGLTRALARLTLRTHVRSDKAHRTLTSVALGEHNLGHDCASSGIIARIDAIRALADYRDDTTLKVLQSIAASEPCVRTQVAWNDDIDSVRNRSCPEEIACWAGAAVAHAATPKQGAQLPEEVLRCGTRPNDE